MKRSISEIYFFPLTTLLLAIAACQTPLPEEIDVATKNLPETIDFNYHIKPILSDRCFKCHGPDANQRQGNLRLDEADEAFKKTTEDNSQASYNLKPKNLNQSEVHHRIISDDPEYMMPPPSANLKLSNEEKAMLVKWIEQGAEYKPHWAFVPPQKEEFPNVKNKEWVNQDLDYFVLDKIERNGLVPSEKATKTTLLRRVTLDLTGLPPTPQEIDQFLQDNSANAYEKVIKRLLMSPRYGERLGVEWLDAARYADSHGYQDDGMRTTWPWRDWVIKAFNKNMPYDQFLTEQIAGDLLPNPTRDQILATCFNRNHPQTQEGGVVPEEYRVEYVADRTNTFGKALMGMTFECARCHDHKYDPISQKEYYALSAFFNNNNDSGVVPYNGEATPTVMLPTEAEEKKLQDLREKMKPLENALVSDNYQTDFKNWLAKRKPNINLKEGLVAAFDFEKELEVFKSTLDLDGNTKNSWAGIGKKGKIISYINQAKRKPDAAIIGDDNNRPTIVEGKNGNGIQFKGDCGIRFNRELDFDRHQPFSVSIWLKVIEEGAKGPIFNNTNGDFEGYRGWTCILNEDRTLSFRFTHVYPDNGIDYQTVDKVPVGKWTHIALSYNGNSKANGLAFFINGKIPAHELLNDNLQKSLLHGSKGSNWSNYPTMLGKENASSIDQIIMDEFLVYNRQLSAIEIKHLFDKDSVYQPSETQLLEYYLVSGKNTSYNKNLKQLTTLRKEENLLTTDFLEVMVMKDKSEARPTFVLDRGMYDAKGEEVSANTPRIFSNLKEGMPKNRLGLAKWLTSTDNPLTARVQVNRIWMMLFGKGLVATQEDFGNQGNLPSHPELLDFLAVDFMENGWDLKAFIKKILMSATYQQSAIIDKSAKDKDPTNQWYSHYPAHRLSAEMIRDNALAASGLLVEKIGGPSVYPYQPKGIWKALATRNATEYKQGTGEDLYRRSMYTVWKRSAPPPSMMNFDAPDRYYCIVSRQKTATPLQSLVLMNDPQFVETARILGERAMLEKEKSVSESISFIFKSLIGRSPDQHELSTISNLYQEELSVFQKDKKRVLALLSIGEQPTNKRLNQAELASYTMVVSTVMNFDEFVMKR